MNKQPLEKCIPDEPCEKCRISDACPHFVDGIPQEKLNFTDSLSQRQENIYEERKEDSKCDCNREFTPFYRANDDPHDIGFSWNCDIHGIQEKHYLIHKTKKDYCMPCNSISRNIKCECEHNLMLCYSCSVKAIDCIFSAPQDDDWKKEFDKRFFNPAIPNPSELKKFISQAIKKAYHDGAHDMDLRVTENFNRGLKDENSFLIKTYKDAARQEGYEKGLTDEAIRWKQSADEYDKKARQEERSRLIALAEKMIGNWNAGGREDVQYYNALQDFITRATNE